jgi:transcriptional regulator with XRE-family HTH domain
MADLLAISQNYLSLIESDKKEPSGELISRIAKSLNVSSDALLFAASNVPDEFNDEEGATYRKLQRNIVTLLLFQMTGELKDVAKTTLETNA